MPIVKKLRKLCRDCDIMFEATGKHQRFCEKCIENRKVAAQQRLTKKMRRIWSKN